MTPPSPATPPPQELSKKEKKKKKKEKKAKEAAESGEEQIEVVCNRVLPPYHPSTEERLLSLPTTSRINASASCCAYPQSARLPTGRERCLYRCVCKPNWLRVVGDRAQVRVVEVDLQRGRDGMSSSLCPGAVGGCQATFVLLCPLMGPSGRTLSDMVLAFSQCA